MNELTRAWPWLVTMAVLIVFSALFSGSEAALFSLRDRDRQRLRRGGVGGRRAAALLSHPEQLLSAILFWNLMINMTYFAIATIVGSRIQSVASSATVLFTIGSLLAIIFFSEMLPKSIGVLSP
ncbi:MAG: CNNM domain-containing protein, partial [Planctomycetota bacterium]